jgi:hypothetical protein
MQCVGIALFKINIEYPFLLLEIKKKLNIKNIQSKLYKILRDLTKRQGLL